MKRTLVVCLLTIMTGSAILAVLGVGDIVFDPTSYAEVVLVYEQLITTYEKIRAEYELLVRMAQTVPVDMGTRYRAIFTPWMSSAPPSDYFGVNSDWVSAINGGQNVLSGYQKATEILNQFGNLPDYPPEALARLKANYATIELQDGANLHTMQAMGTIRANATEVQTAIQALEDDSLSLDPAMNTEIAVLNKINAASIIALRNSQDTNKLLVALLEEQLTRSKRERDTAAAAANAHIEYLNKARSIRERQTSTITESIKSFRMP